MREVVVNLLLGMPATAKRKAPMAICGDLQMMN